MAEGRDAGINRRRVLKGAAWSVPAVLIATSAPARAATLPLGSGIEIQTFLPQYAPYFWDADGGEDGQGASITAVTVAAYLQNMPPEAGGEVSQVATVLYQLLMPVGAPVDVRWGVGTNFEGIPDGADVELVGEPELLDGHLMLTLQWHGTMPVYDGRYVMVWARSDDQQLGNVAAGHADATHANTDTSSDTRAEQTVQIVDIEEWLGFFHEYKLPPDDQPPPNGDG